MANIITTAFNAAKTPLFEVALPLIVGAAIIAVFRAIIRK